MARKTEPPSIIVKLKILAIFQIATEIAKEL